jgi:hypothetical protein
MLHTHIRVDCTLFLHVVPQRVGIWYTVYGTQYTVHGIRYTVHGIRYTVYGTRYTAYEVNVQTQYFCLRRSVLRTQQKNMLASNVINITDLITENVYIKVHNITVLFGG